MKFLVILMMVLGAQFAQAEITTVFNSMAGTKEAKGYLKAFPMPEADEVRNVIYLKPLKKEHMSKVEIMVGSMMKTDACNHYHTYGEIEEVNVDGWGFTAYLSKLGMTTTTLMGCNDPTMTTRFVGGPVLTVRYNSRLPIVVYTKKGEVLKYRIWKTKKSF